MTLTSSAAVLTMTTPRKEITRLYELAKEVREKAQQTYVQGHQDEAMDRVHYAEGIERAIMEIAALNGVATSEMHELRALDQTEPWIHLDPTEPNGEESGATNEASLGPPEIQWRSQTPQPHGRYSRIRREAVLR
jgi:hypothetical protein